MRGRTVLYQGASDYSSYKVVDTIYDGRPARVLYGGHDTPQSGIATDDQPDLLFDYNQRFYELALSLQPQRVLVIGGGAFTLPSTLITRLPFCQVDVVEIDPLLPTLAARYFNLPDSVRLRVFVTNGKDYVLHCKETYDLIIIDAFSEFVIPTELYEAEVIEAYHRLLRPTGTLAMNFISWYVRRRPVLTDELVKQFSESFSQVLLYPADHTYSQKVEQNIVLIASDQTDPHFDYLHSEVVDFVPLS